ncbi:Fe-S oxidoreductase [Sphingobium sp.]|uniref:Fe-S oxidoreductase n=1 Tax=Sphingobium sp. TaxID=1912891 RepID=UPI003B3B506D
MKSIILASAALLGVSSLGTMAIAQDAAAPGNQPPAADAMTSVPAPATPPATPQAAQPSSPQADPNAGVPTGAVPADPGMVPAPADVPHDPAAPVGSSENPVTVGGNVTPPPTEAKDYPTCTRAVQDSCINRGEAPKAARKR